MEEFACFEFYFSKFHVPFCSCTDSLEPSFCSCTMGAHLSLLLSGLLLGTSR